jgi:nucleotide-binding universal stress UspA family protein
MARTRALLCFDGSADAGHAIAVAGELLAPSAATVLTIWEPAALWAPYDPGAVLSAGLSGLAAEELGLDEIAEDLARRTLERGLDLAREAGFDAAGRLACGKPWRVICETAAELDAVPIVTGARGLSRVQSALLGSVSAAITAHAHRAVLVVPAPPAGDDD